jgi:hypothetical protein
MIMMMMMMMLDDNNDDVNDKYSVLTAYEFETFED